MSVALDRVVCCATGTNGSSGVESLGAGFRWRSDDPPLQLRIGFLKGGNA